MHNPGDLVVHCESPADIWQAVDAILARLPAEQGLPLKRLKNEWHRRYVTARKIAEDAEESLFKQLNNRSISEILADLAEVEHRAEKSDRMVTTYAYDRSGQRIDPHSDYPIAD